MAANFGVAGGAPGSGGDGLDLTQLGLTKLPQCHRTQAQRHSQSRSQQRNKPSLLPCSPLLLHQLLLHPNGLCSLLHCFAIAFY